MLYTMAMDPYKTLGVDASATDADIKKAFRKLAVQYHPDRGGDESKFKEINTAYDTIKTADKRQQYDTSKRFGSDGFQFNFNDGQPFDMQDMFTSFFGQNVRPQRRKPTNKNIQIGLECTLEEVYYGCKKEVTIDQIGKTIAIDVPRGIDNGQSVRYKGLGLNQVPNAPAGDLLCRIYVKKHPRYTRQRLDLHVEESVNCFTAMLGTNIDVHNIDSKVIKLKVPAGTQPGTVMRIPEHGMHGMNGQMGNLYVRINISIPNNLTEKDKNDIRTISETYS